MDAFPLPESAAEHLENLQQELEELGPSSLQDFVRNNPWQAVAIAAGAGLLLGVAIRKLS
jgi:ElaB/YqjD/DUF883 family membrane-anchored ribosome-binding protein